MKILTFFGAVLSIGLVQGYKPLEDNWPDPTTHRFWNRVNQNCGLQVQQKQVGFARAANIGEYPWVVLIYITNPATETTSPYTTKCMGSIITNRHIVTAASCFSKFGRDVPEDAVYMTAGELDVDTDPDCYEDDDGNQRCAPNSVNYNLTTVFVYDRKEKLPEFGKNIAVLITDRIIEFNDYVSPICLEYGSRLLKRNYEGKLGIKLSGWGQQSADEHFESKLQHARVLGMGPEQNTKVFDNYPGLFSLDSIRNAAFCTGEFPGVVKPDTEIGSPYMVTEAVGSDVPRIFLVGVMSFKATVTHPNYMPEFGVPDVYSKVKRYLPWILDKLNPKCDVKIDQHYPYEHYDCTAT